MGVYPAVEVETLAKDSGRYFWIRSEDLKSEDLAELDGMGLQREIRTKIWVYPGKISFSLTNNIIKPEVEYVCRRIL